MAEPMAWAGWAPVLVFMGAGVGALLRWGLAEWLNAVSPGLPWGTLLANLIGGMLIGLAMPLLSPQAFPTLDPGTLRLLRLLAVTGFLGGLTTFSTFSAEVVDFVDQGRWMHALGWAAMHLAGSLSLTAAGWALARMMMGPAAAGT